MKLRLIRRTARPACPGAPERSGGIFLSSIPRENTFVIPLKGRIAIPQKCASQLFRSAEFIPQEFRAVR